MYNLMSVFYSLCHIGFCRHEEKTKPSVDEKTSHAQDSRDKRDKQLFAPLFHWSLRYGSGTKLGRYKRQQLSEICSVVS
jgi:hypothetical protein